MHGVEGAGNCLNISKNTTKFINALEPQIFLRHGTSAAPLFVRRQVMPVIQAVQTKLGNTKNYYYFWERLPIWIICEPIINDAVTQYSW